MKTEIEFIPYGEISSRLARFDQWRVIRRRHTSSLEEKNIQPSLSVFLSFSRDLDETFVEMFRKRAAQETRLVILNEDASTDSLISRIFDLQIRTPSRCFIFEPNFDYQKPHFMRDVNILINRLVSAYESGDGKNRILHARIEDGVLHVISPDFSRLDVQIEKIPQLKNVEPSAIRDIEIDEDGAFIYWPKLDVHMGWPQLQQLVDPHMALKAAQKHQEFNQKYGKAVQKLRELAGLEKADVPGISEKQLSRIERGECRLTSNAIEILSKTHGITPNEYMRKLADYLD